jgi:uncharacterized protein (TIGR02453 family)
MGDGFPKEAFAFLASLEKNNRKEWFSSRKDEYASCVRAPFEELVIALNAELARFAKEYQADTRKISRVHRDVRFSKDKSPYRTDISVVFPRSGGEKDEVAGYYLSLSSQGATILGGAYMPGTPQLARLREAIAREPARFRRVVTEKSLVELMGPLEGEQLKRVPRGFPADHEAADFLRLKQAYFSKTVPKSVVVSDGLLEELTSRLRAMRDFVRLLDEWMAG